MSEKPDSSTYADKRMTAGSIQKAVIDTREKGLYHSAVLDKGIDHDKETGSRKLNRVDRIVKKMIISLDVEKKSITGILKHDLLGMKGEVYAARSALSHMRSARPALSNDEVMKILLILKDKHRLGEFLLLSGEPDIMKYLANKNVSRIFIIENWELTWDDILAFMSGFVAGAVSDWVEGWYALAQMIGSAYMKGVAAQFEATKAVLTADKKKIIEIVDDMHQFWLAIGMMWEQINLNPIKGYENWSKQVDEAFIHLDFKTAGRLYGELLIAIIDMASIVFAFASGAGKLSKKIVKHIPKKTIVRMLYNIKNIKLLSYNELLKLLSPINVKDLRNALKKLDEYMSVEGFQFGGLVPCYAQATAGTAGQGAIGFYVTIVNRTKKEVIFLSSKTYDTIGKQLMSILDDFMDDIEVFGKTYGDLSVPKRMKPNRRKFEIKGQALGVKEPVLANNYAPMPQRIQFIIDHAILFGDIRKATLKKFLKTLIKKKKLSKKDLKKIRYYEDTIDKILKKPYLNELDILFEQGILPFRVTSASKITTEGLSKAASGGDAEKILRSLAEGQVPALSWTSRLKSDPNIKVQLDAYDALKKRVIEIKSAIKHHEQSLPLDINSVPTKEIAKLEDQMLRQAQFVKEWGLQANTWVAFSDEMADFFWAVRDRVKKINKELAELIDVEVFPMQL